MPRRLLRFFPILQWTFKWSFKWSPSAEWRGPCSQGPRLKVHTNPLLFFCQVVLSLKDCHHAQGEGKCFCNCSISFSPFHARAAAQWLQWIYRLWRQLQKVQLCSRGSLPNQKAQTHWISPGKSVNDIQLLMGCISSSPCLPDSSLHTHTQTHTHTHSPTLKDPFCVEPLVRSAHSPVLQSTWSKLR